MGSWLFERDINWQRLIFIFILIDAAIFGLACAVLARLDNPNVQIALRIPSPTTTYTPTQTPTPGPTGTPTPWPSQTPIASIPTATATWVIVIENDATATVVAQMRATAQAKEEAQALAQLQTWMQPHARRFSPGISGRTEPLVLAHYFAWFDGAGWDDCNISAADKPLLPYDSDDPAAIARHIQMAQSIGINGFTLHWFAPNDPTDRNLSTLLIQAQGTDFLATVVFSHHIWHGLTRPSQAKISTALGHILVKHSRQPNFLRVNNKPVIFFTDIYRVPTSPGQTPQQFWAAVRDEVDPARQSIWIAEGLDPSYLDVFDGLYVFKITHATAPHDYHKNTEWAGWVRAKEEQTGQPKYWVGTIMPGWDDLRSPCKPEVDVRVATTPHRLDRANGATYEATFQAALESNPDWLIVGSFNEWVEGSYIEPSILYGDYYMQLTADFVRRFQKQIAWRSSKFRL